MTKINFANSSFKKKLAFPLENKAKRNNLQQRNLLGVSQWSVEKRAAKIDVKDLNNKVQVNQKQSLQMKQLVKMIGSRINPNLSYVNKSCN